MTVEKNEQAFVLTGGPGVGKTALLVELRGRGLYCVSEPARIVLAEQRALVGEALPDVNSKAFCDLLVARSIQDFGLRKNYNEITIFDRGVPDNIAYASSFGLDVISFNLAAASYVYNEKVFLLSPWEEIYTTDHERKMNFHQVCEFHEEICRIYKKLGYRLIEVPPAAVAERARFIQSIIST